MGQVCHKGSVGVIHTKVLMGDGFLARFAKHNLTAEELSQLGEFLKVGTSKMQETLQDTEDAVTNTYSLLHKWTSSARDGDDATALYGQLSSACLDIGRPDLVEFVQNGLTEERIKVLTAAANPPIKRKNDKGKGDRILTVMSILKGYEDPDLWAHVSVHFVEGGHLDMSRVLLSTNLPYLVYLFTAGVASDVTALTLSENHVLGKDEAGRSVGACLASMSQLYRLLMADCHLTLKTLHHVLHGITNGCSQIEILDFSNNIIFNKEEAGRLLGAALILMTQLCKLHVRASHFTLMSWRHVVDGITQACQKIELLDCRCNPYLRCRSEETIRTVLTRLPLLTIRAHDCGLSVRCAGRLTTQFGDRFNQDQNG